MIRANFLILVMALLMTAGSAFSQAVGKNEPVGKTTSPGPNIMPLSEVKEGMRGIARTVFRGTEPEEFNVEIIGIIPAAIGPKQDLIVGKISGGGADRTAVFAGMSGSPVYVNGRLVGALSYSFPFSKEAFCGITPIEQMIQIFEKKPSTAQKATTPRSVSFSELASTEWKPALPGNATVASSIFAGADASSPLNVLAGQAFMPIGTPLTFSGFSQTTLNRYAPQLMSVGLIPVAAVGGGAPLAPMKPFDDQTLVGGDSVTMQLTRGDFTMAASGTVTLRDGEKVYAFGHPFLSLGSSDLAMSESHVLAVIPSVANSFKIAVPDSMVGSMSQDRATGVFGKLGQAPSMIPVKLTMTTSRNQEQVYNYEIARDNFLTPLLLSITTANALASQERGIGDSTIRITGDIQIKGQQPIKVERRYTGMFASQMASSVAAIPISLLGQSGFSDAQVTGVNLNISSDDGEKSANLERISLDKGEVRAGETFEVRAFVRTNTGQMFVEKIPVKIPTDTPAGKLLVSIGDGLSIQRLSPTSQFVPKDLADMIKTINEVKKSDQLYVQTYRVTNGAVIGAKELPNLPPSVLATLDSDRTAGSFKPTVMTLLTDQEVAPAEFVIAGQQMLTIEVIR